MKANHFVWPGLVMLFVAALALPSQTLADDDDENDDGISYSISMVREFDPGPAPLTGGSSTLVRAPDGVAFNLSTTDLAPVAPYTVWFVGFNPGNPCIDKDGVCTCGEDDIDSVFWAAGAMTDLLGSATFVGNTNYGELPDGEDQVPFDDFAKPLRFGAEIHFVIRAHGEALGGDKLLEQLTQFNGGCPPNPEGEPGGCYDEQFSVHRAPVCTNGPNANLGIDDDDDDDDDDD